MRPDLALPLTAGTGFLTPAWRSALGRLALVWLALQGLGWRQWAAMADQWWNSSTYTHVLLVPAIIGWLVSQRTEQLRQLEPRPWAVGLVPFAVAALVWLAGQLAGVALAEQLGAVLLLVSAVPVLLGPRLAAALAFPLGYMLALVPFGDELVPLLQTITAKMTVALVHLSGVPAHINGVFIDTPAGLFEVAEACSGVKFLVAMLAFAALAAHVCFISWRRRAAFLATSAVVPVLANAVRAWGTVFVAQSKGAEWAGGFDHIVYGWIFFGIVIALVLGLWWRWFDRPADAPLVDLPRLAASPLLARLEQGVQRPTMVLAGLVALALGSAAWAQAADRLEAPLPARLVVPQVTGWHAVAYQPLVAWEPRAAGAGRRLLVRYADATGRTVDVFYAAYAAQGPGRKASGQGEGALRPDSGWQWLGFAPSGPEAKAERLRSEHGVIRYAETSYRTGDLLSGSAARLRLANFLDRLALRAERSEVLILSAEAAPGTADPAPAVRAFRQALGRPEQWMDAVAVGG